MKKFALGLMVLVVAFSGYSQTREDVLKDNLGFTDVTALRAVPENLQKTLISVAIVEDNDKEPSFNLKGEILGKLSSDYIKLADGIFKIEDIFIAQDSKGNAVLVLWTSQIICFLYDAVDPAFARIGVTMMIQVLYPHQGKSIKIFIK